MNNAKEYQYAELLQVAVNQLSYCKIISKYPWDGNIFSSKDISSNFFKRVCNACFLESCLIICNLLDKKDEKVISFFNWEEFVSDNIRKQILDDLVKTPDFKQLLICRHQIFAHQNNSNKNNNFPSDRLRLLINDSLINWSDKILSILIRLFDNYTRSNNRPYSFDSYFWTENSETEIEFMLNWLKPKIEKN